MRSLTRRNNKTFCVNNLSLGNAFTHFGPFDCYNAEIESERGAEIYTVVRYMKVLAPLEISRHLVKLLRLKRF